MPQLVSLRLRATRMLTTAAGLIGLAIALAGSGNALAQSRFYRAAPAEVAGAPGSIIRMETMRGAPLGAQAYRVLYRSIGLKGEPIAVSGVIVVPSGSAPEGGRPIVAWAHPTTGVVPRCAPSLAIFVFQSMMGLRDLVKQGYVVAATDYPGLGTPGPHPYLVGVSEGRAVIDAVRAARQVPGASAGTRYALWGHSQGGHAALYAAMLTADYAPELQLTGVAVAAPATDLKTLLRDDADTNGGRNITAMTLWSWSRVFDAPIENVVVPAAMPAVDALSNECIESIYDILMREQSQKPLATQFLSVKDVTTVEPWQSLLQQNVPGTLPPKIPVFVAQGDADMLVRPAVTRAYVGELCAAGSAVDYVVLPGVGHGFSGRDAATAAVQWIGDRMAGQAPPTSCPRRN